MHGKRNFGLDLARATAISMVYLSHGITVFHSLGIGVDLFFVLSGFLIGRIYFRSQAQPDFSFWRFWQARWWRTLPPYYAAIGVFLLLNLAFPSQPRPIPWYYLFFLQNYLGVRDMGVTWSLCVEEHFYLALPILGWLAIRYLGRQRLIWVLPLLALFPQLFRLTAILTTGLPADWYWITHFHSEGLVLGVFLAYLFVDHPKLWGRIRPIALGLSLIPVVLLIALSIHYTPSLKLHGGIFLYYALGFAGWVRVAYDIQWAPKSMAANLVKKSIHGLALCSYSVYLLHTAFFTDMRLLIANWNRGAAKSIFILLSSFLMCVIFYFLVERPTIIWRDRSLRKRKKAAAPNSPAARVETV
ncbi:MAG: acyltransferase [Acidobacteria bacterium]|nr:acyltransferase [Acidobacteriota bacterium]